MAEANLPEEILVLILSFLPVKSLIRFTCVSKHFHFIILSDPKFAISQFQTARDRKTPTRRLLYITVDRVESLDLETPSFGEPSSGRNLKFPFQPPSDNVKLLGSCNGIVFLVFDEDIYYLWNPSTDFFMKMKSWPSIWLGVANFQFPQGGSHYRSSLGVSAGGCLSLAPYPPSDAQCIDVWVMREYGVRDSWTKLFNFKFSEPPLELGQLCLAYGN